MLWVRGYYYVFVLMYLCTCTYVLMYLCTYVLMYLCTYVLVQQGLYHKYRTFYLQEP
jgi:hypothetical protein